MKEFIAKNATQLDRRLKLLFVEHIEFTVEVRQKENLKIFYAVLVDIDDKKYAELEEKIRVLR